MSNLKDLYRENRGLYKIAVTEAAIAINISIAEILSIARISVYLWIGYITLAFLLIIYLPRFLPLKNLDAVDYRNLHFLVLSILVVAVIMIIV